MMADRPVTERCIKHGEDIIELRGVIAQHRTITDNMDSKLDTIIMLVTATNGRVKTLELINATAEGIREGIGISSKIIWTLFGGAATSGIWIFLKYLASMQH